MSLVTRSGTNQFNGSGYWLTRRTVTSSNEYFLKLTQVLAEQESVAPKLDKDIFGGSFGGPVKRSKMFFFGNYEKLRSNSETPVVRAVPSDSFRDGVLVYQCAVPSACPGGGVAGFRSTHNVPAGWFGLTPAQTAALDPLGIGPSRGASDYFRQYPSPNEPGLDGRNIMDFRFAAPITNDFHTFIGRVDYRFNDNQSVFVRFNLQDDTINGAPQFPGGDPRSENLLNNAAFAIGYDAALSASLVNSFRYGSTGIDSATTGRVNDNYVIFRFIAPIDPNTFASTRTTPTQNIVNDLSWLKGRHTLKTGANLRFTRIPSTRDSGSWLNATVNPSWVDGVGRKYHARCGRLHHAGVLPGARGRQRVRGGLRRRLAQHARRPLAGQSRRELRS